VKTKVLFRKRSKVAVC
jgi:hypothetical protein